MSIPGSVTIGSGVVALGLMGMLAEAAAQSKEAPRPPAVIIMPNPGYPYPAPPSPPRDYMPPPPSLQPPMPSPQPLPPMLPRT